MIDGFEDITYELTDFEKNQVVPKMVECLSKKFGKDKAIKNKEIIEEFDDEFGIKLTQARNRKIIGYIRLNGLVERLMATSKGYYISDDNFELLKYINSLHQRANMILMMADQMDYQRKELINEK